ncbi:hypothetical protein [Jiella pelagia]|uniref:Secreted protein n=1 Tax=Jiella pelagia TaxID=2986949 RepID=A0ABY7C2E5_9HYPH|nr:hypothetical protein [Jiella pelagia]WAP69510.1 hypothetical protein OH818_04460 [Jiella pelagia]
MGSWIGPAIVAAVIVGIFTVAGWFVTASLALRAEQRRRREKARDFRIALRAEIMSELANLEAYDRISLDQPAAEASAGAQPVPFIPTGSRNRIFEAIVGEIYILPEPVIEPLVRYGRQRDILEGLGEDLRRLAAGEASQARIQSLFDDYLKLRKGLKSLAEDVVAILSRTD